MKKLCVCIRGGTELFAGNPGLEKAVLEKGVI